MSVRGDGNGKDENEPVPSQDDDGTAAESDVPPYDAVTEVFPAIGSETPDEKPASESVPDDEVTAASPVEPPSSPDPETAPTEPEVVAPSEPDVDAEAPTVAQPVVERPNLQKPVVEQPAVEQPPTEAIADEPPATTPPPPVDPAPAEPEPAGEKPSWIKIAVVAGAAVACLAVFYTADVLSTQGSVPRGVTVAGVQVGGLSHDDAEAVLRSELGPRVDQPVAVKAGDQQLEFVPAAAGLDVDWSATLDRAGSQPINPFTRLASFFTDREIGVESTVDPGALDATVEQIRAQTDREPVEGDVVFEGNTPVPVTPAPGQTVDVQSARDAIESEWAFGSVDIPVETVDVNVHQDEVDRVLESIAAPAVSAPVVFTGKDNAEAVLAPQAVANILSFEPEGEQLAPRYDNGAATAILAPQLASTEIQPRDASFALGGGAPTIVPGVVGETVQWEKTLEQLPNLLADSESRSTEAIYEPAPPELTTEGAEALGINEVIGEFTTGGFEYASGVNIGLTANIVNGALVKPGETFSLNEYTGPRGTAQGFVESGIIDNGRPDRAVGGGISQFATTLYNASYFGGMEDAGHTEHSYYISRYPEAREATVFEGAIDLKFTNPTDTGVVIQSFATSSNVTVRLWGTKTVDVQSVTGQRTNPTSPNTITLPAGPGCVASSGGPGFTTSDTRIITDIASGNQVSRNTRTVTYDPVPIVRCESPEPPPEPEADEPEDEQAPEAGTPPPSEGE